MDSMENLEWLAFSRGYRAVLEFIAEKHPTVDTETFHKEYLGSEDNSFNCQKDFDEWRSRSYVEEMRRKAIKENYNG